MEISPKVFTDIPKLKDTYDQNGFVIIDNFLSEQAVLDTSTFVKDMPLTWGRTAVSSPGDEGDTAPTYGPLDYFVHFQETGPHNLQSFAEAEACEAAVAKANTSCGANQFSYHFDRTTTGEHYPDCRCYGCKFIPFMETEEITELFTDITGEVTTRYDEAFFSKYTAGNFLSPHHDGDKGQLTITLYLTPTGSPHGGGTLTVLEEDGVTIRSTVQPTYNSLFLCSMAEGDYPHFVSHIPSYVTAKRFAFQGWYR